MKNIIFDIASFLKTLTVIDYILYVAILVLLILIVSLIYLLKTTDIEGSIQEENDDFDIKNTVKELSEATPREMELTDYEKEQEQNAIISYDELINSTKNNKINYETDELLNDKISVKKFDLDNLVSEGSEQIANVRVITFEHEEAFLQALKTLQKLLD